MAQSGVLAGDPDVVVIADGLNGPRGISLGPLGEVYVTESGVGGEEPCELGPTGEIGCFGESGGITRLRPHSRRVIDSLESVGSESGSATGPHDLQPFGPLLLTLVGFGMLPEQRDALGEAADGLGTLRWLLPRGNGSFFEWQVADLASFEGEKNPDGGDLVSNPYAMALRGREILVVDAGGNSLLGVSWSGRVELLAVFPERLVPAPPDIPVPQIPMQSVPTSVLALSEGDILVGEFTGFPFPPGAANVYKIADGEDPEVYLSGFTNVIDLAQDAQGRLLVLEHAASGLLSGDPSGRLVRIDSAGNRENLLEGDVLQFPTSLAVDARGRMLIANCGTCGEGAGSVLRYQPPM